MAFNVLELHDSAEDTTTRRLLRAYSVLPRFSKKSTGAKAEQAIRIVKFLREANERLKKEIAPNWKNEWIESIGYSFTKPSYKDWFIGRASIPLIAIEKLKDFGLEKEVEELVEGIEYISTTTKEAIKIPKKITPDLLYLSGFILGDGCLPIKYDKRRDNMDYIVLFISNSKEFLETKIKPIMEELFEINYFPMRYYVNIGSAWEAKAAQKAIYRFLTKTIGIPNGKKSHKALIPPIVKQLPPKKALPFLAGLIDSDIGKHSGGMGSSFRSKQIVEDLIEFLGKLEITAKTCGVYYKNNIYPQHDFRIPKSQVKKLKELLDTNYLPKRKDRLETLSM